MKQTWQQAVGSCRAVFQTSPVGVALTSADASSLVRILEVNPTFCAITGYSPDQLLGLDFQALTHPEDVEVGLALAHRVTSGEVPGVAIEKRYLHAHGHVVWVRLFASLVGRADGAPACLLTRSST